MPTTRAPSPPTGPATPRGGWAAPVLGFVALYGTLDGTAALTDSRRGEAGAWVCAAVVLVAAIVERLLAGHGPRAALAAVGLRRPTARGFGAALAIAALLALALPAIARLAGTGLRWADDAAAVAVGVVLQGGVAEEVVWRGYLFRRLRAGRRFARAATLSAAVVAAQHLLLFRTLPAPVAAAAVGVAVATSFAFARLFERSGGSVLGPALVHAVIQGALKVVVVEDPDLVAVPLAWMAASVVLPLGVFALPRERAPAAA